MAKKRAAPPQYFRHTGGPAWGAGVLLAQTKEQRTFLFADGVQRTFKEEFCARFIVAAEAPEDEAQERLARGKKAGGAKATPVAIHRELEDQIRAAPDDPGPYLVYADWLLDRKDPRGELISLQHQLADAPNDRARRAAEKKLLADHDGYFHPRALAELLAIPRRGDPAARAEVTWRTGYYERIRIARQTENQPELVPALTDAIAHPSAQFLRSIVLGPLGGSKFIYGPLLDAIKQTPPALLEELVIGDFTDERNELAYSSAGNLSPLVHALPALARLRVRAGSVRFDTPLKHAALRELAITTVDLTDATREKLFASQLPALETLEITAPKASLLSILQRSGDRFPALRRLALHATQKTGAILRALANTPLLAHLEVLELTDGDLADLPAIDPRPFAHLRRLDLGGNPLPRPVAIQLRALGKHVFVEPRVPAAAAPIDLATISEMTDADSLQAARAVARPSKWFALRREGDRLTGRYRGRSGGIYLTSARLDRDDADCSCRSDRNPCKHAIGLLLIAAGGYPFTT